MLEKATIDTLTGFFLREALFPLLEKNILGANLSEKSFSVAMIDLDHFKKFNDKFGHLFGDDILKYASSTLRLTLDEVQCNFFRYGGDEFIVVFPEKEPREALRLLKQCNYNLVHRPFLFKNKFYKITFSCGIACFPGDGKKGEELIARADAAMYFSKRHGRNLITLSSRIRFLKIRNIFLKLLRLGLIFLFLYAAYRLVLKNIVQSTFRQIEDVKIVKKPKNLDKLILKSGEIFEGNIVEETQDKIILSLYLEQGEGTLIFKKSEIAKIEYKSVASPQKEKAP